MYLLRWMTMEHVHDHFIFPFWNIRVDTLLAFDVQMYIQLILYI